MRPIFDANLDATSPACRGEGRIKYSSKWITAMKSRPALFVLFVVLALPALARASDGVELLSVRRIWDQAPHNAFTSLLRFQDRWVCAFREAPAHVGPGVEGKMRVISSADTDRWDSVALLEDSRGDIRDAKLSVMPDGRLMLLTA